VNFLGAVNRVLVNDFILKGDDDLITDFNSNQHEGTIRLAKNAIQRELNALAAHFPLDYEKMSGSITTVASQRTYTLPADFIRFLGSRPFLYLDTDQSDRMFEWHGGEDQLRRDDWKYLTTEGEENWWYWDQTTVKSIGLYNIPDTASKQYDFDYERNVSVSNGTDVLPFQNETESETFADMASRRFTYMRDPDRDLADLEKDNEYTTSFGTLLKLMQPKNPNNRYGRAYRSADSQVLNT